MRIANLSKSSVRTCPSSQSVVDCQLPLVLGSAAVSPKFAVSLFDSEWNRILRRVPRKFHNAATSLRHNRNRELIHRRRQRLSREVQTCEILRCIVVRAPLPSLTIDDELRASRTRQSPESVFPRGNELVPDHEISRRRELR